MIALSRAKLNIFSPESKISLRIKPKKKRQENVFVMSLRLSDHKVLHNIASSASFLDFARIFSLFSLVFRNSKFLEFKEFNKTIIPIRACWI